MNRRIPLIAGSFLVVGAVLGVGLKTVLAGGVPTSNPLYYSGTLTENGQLVNAPRQIMVNLWTNDMPQMGEVALCSTNVASTPVINGRFRVALDSACKGAVNANADAYVEVVVGGTTSLGRAKIGAVPYAVEADHSTNADNATGAASFAVANNLSVGGTTTLGGPLDVNGRTTFAKGSGFATSNPIAYAGAAYPRSGTFASSGGTLVLLVDGSAYLGVAGGPMRLQVDLDGSSVGSLTTYTNEASSHKTMTGNPIIVPGIAAGMHTVKLSLVAVDTAKWPIAQSDTNDYSAVTVLELPL